MAPDPGTRCEDPRLLLCLGEFAASAFDDRVPVVGDLLGRHLSEVRLRDLRCPTPEVLRSRRTRRRGREVRLCLEDCLGKSGDVGRDAGIMEDDLRLLDVPGYR